MEEKKFKSGTALRQQKLSNYYKTPINLEKDNRLSGAYAWIAVAALIASYDYYAIKTKNVETMTRAFWRATESPIKAVAPVATWLLLTTHLLAEKKIRRKILKTDTVI